MLRIVFPVAALVVLFGVTSARADDRDEIRKAAEGFVKALQEGSTKDAHKYAATSDKTDKYLDAVVEITAARSKLVQASIDKFGDEGKSIAGAARAPMGVQFNKKDFDEADIEVSGDTAVVKPKTGQRSAKFKREAGEWKFDFADLPNAEQLSRQAPLMSKTAGAMKETAEEIKDGKYKTADEAKQALREKMLAAVGVKGGRP